MAELFPLPEGLPVPQDDGACNHLPGMRMPELLLPSTSGRGVPLRAASHHRAVFFFYPRSGRPGEAIHPDWDAIPGARGCTPHSCGYRDLHAEFAMRGASVFGVSCQDTEYQRELVERAHLPYEILSDAEFRLTEALRLPTFEYRGMRLIKRLALWTEAERIVKVFYPVFPPNRNAEEVISWLRSRA